jgi:FAD synthetase
MTTTPSSACLIALFDQQLDQEHQALTYLMEYVNLKLKRLGITLTRIFFIIKSDLEDILKQIEDSVANQNVDVTLVATANINSDSIIDTIYQRLGHNDTKSTDSTSIYSFKNRAFFFKNNQFHANFAEFISRIQFSTTISSTSAAHFLFNTDTDLRRFIDQHFTGHTVLYEVEENKNYAKYALAVSLNSIRLDTVLIPQLVHITDYLLNNNFINADNLVYNFEQCVRLFHTDLNNNDGVVSAAARHDLQFLRDRIDVPSLCVKVRHAIDLIESVEKTATGDHICVSFNGGKDCCIVLYLLYAVALRLATKFPLNVLFIQIKDSFAQMDEFVEHAIKRFYTSGSLEFITFNENADTFKSLKECLFELKVRRPSISHILMGTRRSDGAYFKQMPDLSPTDGDWPTYVRVNPILDWTYSEVWYFMRLLKLPYCSLYDHGYTSIDHTGNTVANEALHSDKDSAYAPAYLLSNGELERQSRKKL